VVQRRAGTFFSPLFYRAIKEGAAMPGGTGIISTLRPQAQDSLNTHLENSKNGGKGEGERLNSRPILPKPFPAENTKTRQFPARPSRDIGSAEEGPRRQNQQDKGPVLCTGEEQSRHGGVVQPGKGSILPISL